MEHKPTPKTDSLGAKRVGSTSEERLKWVIDEFVQKDMNLTRQEEKIALGKDLRLLIPAGWEGLEKNKPMDAATVDRLHRHISEGVNSLLRSHNHQWRIPRVGGLSLIRSGAAGQYQLTGEGGEFEGVIVGVFNMIMRLGSRLKSCEECSKPFVAIRRQEYCSTPCSQRARDRRRK